MDGIAGCFWRLNPDPSQPSQQLTATLLNLPEHIPQGPAFVVVTGNHSLAGTDPGIHVEILRLNIGAELVSDTEVTADQLASGLRRGFSGVTPALRNVLGIRSAVGAVV